MKNEYDVALIQMPFAMPTWPSLGLGLLKSALKSKGIESRVHYFNLDFAEMTGVDLYEAISAGQPSYTDLIGEWIFSESLWGRNDERDFLYLNMVFPSKGSHNVQDTPGSDGPTREQVMCVRGLVQPFLESAIAEIDWRLLKIVGITSVFQQHVAALALAKQLKSRFPHLTIVIGGSNCEGEMGLTTLRNFPFVDAVCSGEGDVAFPDYVERRLAGDITPVSGMLEQKRDSALLVLQSQAVQTLHISDMDGLPYPDYDDYFVRASSLLKEKNSIRIVFETSRGCWWGQRHHCTFCGLNGLGMAFRHKSAQRALAEVKFLIDRYGEHTRKFHAADNIIPMEYFHSFLPELERLENPIDLFYETKANLTEAQIAQYKRSGLSAIQPGIESLNATVLALMRKGVSVLQNIQLLKWCSQYGIHPFWNYLFGFPGEVAASYNGQVALMKKMRHLTPPVGCCSVRFDRFSPFFEDADAFGITDLAAYPAYELIYSGLPKAEVHKLAYYFCGAFAEQPDISQYSQSINCVVADWRGSGSNRALFHTSDAFTSVIFDCRETDLVRVIVLRGVENEVFRLSSSIVGTKSLMRQAESAYGKTAAYLALDKLLSFDLLLQEQDRLLSLSIPLGHAYAIPETVRKRLSKHLNADFDNLETISIPHGSYEVL